MKNWTNEDFREFVWGLWLMTREDEELFESNYVLLMHRDSKVNKWSDDLGKKYHFGRIANYTKIQMGTKTIWFDRKDGEFTFWGFGTVNSINKEDDENFIATMKNFHFFDPPRIADDNIQGKITKQPGYNIQSSILPITKEIYDQILGTVTIPNEEQVTTFDDESLPTPTKDDLKQGYEKISDELLIPEEKITEIITALASGRHVLLAGPIGTGKTELARRIPEIFWERYGGYYSEDHTATSDWSTQDVIGGIFPKMGKNGTPIYEIQNGCVTETVQKNWLNGKDGGPRRPSAFPAKTPSYRGTWLIIDEFNRADIDKAFGQLFTALRTRTLKIPTDKEGQSYKTLKIPLDYRIIGTLNTADKHFLFQLSDALKSRFAYIEIDIPEPAKRDTEIYYAMKNAIYDLKNDSYDDLILLDHQNKTINKERSNPEFYNRVYQAYTFLDSVRLFKKLGTAILKLTYQNLLIGTKITGNTKLALDNALTSNLTPQLENLSPASIGTIKALHSDNIVKHFQDAYDNPNRQSYVEAFIKTLNYLQIPNNPSFILDFTNGNLNNNDSRWSALQIAYDSKKKEFEMDLNQLKQSMDDLIKTMIV
jgi:MoxR-like ATPase